ncbi:MAG: hypothetical protein VCA55_12890 [Verrucomicrobiales bacterium]
MQSIALFSLSGSYIFFHELSMTLPAKPRQQNAGEFARLSVKPFNCKGFSFTQRMNNQAENITQLPISHRFSTEPHDSPSEIHCSIDALVAELAVTRLHTFFPPPATQPTQQGLLLIFAFICRTNAHESARVAAED